MIHLVPALFAALWLMWGLYWLIESKAVKANSRAESVRSRLMHVVPMGVATLLLVLKVRGWPDQRFLPPSSTAAGLGFLMTAAGLLFAVWARRHLATNWSADVTLKVGHELITSGPYAWVRHPIYTGLLLAFLGSAIAVGEWRAVVAVTLVGLTFWRKLRTEERGMRELFSERYIDYSRRVPALIPCVV
jgi:protein-S-isoprenylcysteine O-methyltransferase Ste14